MWKWFRTLRLLGTIGALVYLVLSGCSRGAIALSIVVGATWLIQQRNRHLVGLSLSFCVRDVMRGAVREDEIETIVSGIKAPTDKSWEEVMDKYCDLYWDEYPEQARAVANRLRDAGKIQQPRAEEGKEGHNIGAGYWLMNGRQTRL